MTLSERGVETTRRSIISTPDRAGHGLEMALQVGDRDGEAAEHAWFKEHKALPLHDASDCPMHPTTH